LQLHCGDTYTDSKLDRRCRLWPTLSPKKLTSLSFFSVPRARGYLGAYSVPSETGLLPRKQSAHAVRG
jgi:hypothetical protein